MHGSQTRLAGARAASRTAGLILAALGVVSCAHAPATTPRAGADAAAVAQPPPQTYVDEPTAELSTVFPPTTSPADPRDRFIGTLPAGETRAFPGPAATLPVVKTPTLAPEQEILLNQSLEWHESLIDDRPR